MKGFGNHYKPKKKSDKKTDISLDHKINQAINFHIKGNIREAIKYYQHLISQGCINDRVFSNYGMILRDQGKLKDAEIYTRKAIEINPNLQMLIQIME